MKFKLLLVLSLGLWFAGCGKDADKATDKPTAPVPPAESKSNPSQPGNPSPGAPNGGSAANPATPQPVPSGNISLSGSCDLPQANSCNGYVFEGKAETVNKFHGQYKAACGKDWVESCPASVGRCDLGTNVNTADLTIKTAIWLSNRTVAEAKQFCELIGKPFIQ